MKHYRVLASILFACMMVWSDGAKPEPGKNFKLTLSAESTPVEMIWCAPGTFTMGSPETEDGRTLDETAHTVTLTRGFWLAQVETTQGLWKAIHKITIEQQRNRSSRFGEINGSGADFPMYHVRWGEAMNFCKKLSELERAGGRLPAGYAYCLPTEAQWEYACRAGSTKALNSNKDLTDQLRCPELDKVGWFRGNSGGEDRSAGVQVTGEKMPNAWGFLDMHGNVGEWCLDSCTFDYTNEILECQTYVDGIKDPLNRKGNERIYRGGCWNFPATFCRSASRRCQPPKNSGSHVGFRIALIPIDQYVKFFPFVLPAPPKPAPAPAAKPAPAPAKPAPAPSAKPTAAPAAKPAPAPAKPAPAPAAAKPAPAPAKPAPAPAAKPAAAPAAKPAPAPAAKPAAAPAAKPAPAPAAKPAAAPAAAKPAPAPAPAAKPAPAPAAKPAAAPAAAKPAK